jgi:DNA-binding LytR/AlgR family response regulator
MNELVVLAVDDEPPALAELSFLLAADPRVGEVLGARSGDEALRVLADRDVDAVFLDIRMPGLSGLDIGRALARFAVAPAVVFVSAYDDAAVDAFALRAVDYLLKPVSEHRLAEAVRRVVDLRRGPAEAGDPLIAVELGGVTRFVHRTEVRYVEAHGDYARLHTATGSHLLRIPLTTLEDTWSEAGFARVHRSYLVALGHVRELRVDAAGGHQVLVGGTSAGDVLLPVSRRHSRSLRDRLVAAARPASRG